MGGDGQGAGSRGVARSVGRRLTSFPPPAEPRPDVSLSPPRPCLYLCPRLALRYAAAPPAAGVRGTITRFVVTIPSASSTYHFYELDVSSLDTEWLESKERRREWVDFGEAVNRVSWKAELAQGLMLSSLAPKR
jgi:hypothetical protein